MAPGVGVLNARSQPGFPKRNMQHVLRAIHDTGNLNAFWRNPIQGEPAFAGEVSRAFADVGAGWAHHWVVAEHGDAALYAVGDRVGGFRARLGGYPDPEVDHVSSRRGGIGDRWHG